MSGLKSQPARTGGRTRHSASRVWIWTRRARAVGFRTAWLTALGGELESVEAGLGAVKAAVAARPSPAFDALPLVVVSRGPAARPDAVESRDYAAWMDLQRDSLRSSSNATQVVATTSEHFIQAVEWQTVVNAVLSVKGR